MSRESEQLQAEQYHYTSLVDRDDELDTDAVPVTNATYLFAMCAALNSCSLGYDIGVNTNAGPLLQDPSTLNLSNEQLEIFMGSLNFFSIFGTLLLAVGTSSAASTENSNGGSEGDRIGRRGSFAAASVGFIIGISVLCFAQSYEMLMFGRILVGLGVGFGLAIDPMYIAEISPPSHRGKLVTWAEIGINVGIVFGFASGFLGKFFKPDLAWRLMFGGGLIFPLLLIPMVIWVMPESPRWLVSNGREKEAKVVLKKLYPPGYNVDSVVKDIRESIELERLAESASTWSDLFFPGPALRGMLVVGAGTAVAQQIVGIDAIQYFLLFIIGKTGITDPEVQRVVLIGLGVIKLGFIFVSARFVDTQGRRSLFFVSLGGLIASLLLIAICFQFDTNTSAVLTLIGLACYLAFFEIGMGPGGWLIPSEVFSNIIRTKAMTIAVFLNRFSSTVMSSTFLSVANAVGYSGFFFILAFVCILVLIFFYVFLPETKGKSLEEMSVFFAEITGDRSVLDAEKRLRELHQLSRIDANIEEGLHPSFRTDSGSESGWPNVV